MLSAYYEPRAFRTTSLKGIKTAHMPEVIFSWLMTLDSYYHKDMCEYLDDV